MAEMVMRFAGSTTKILRSRSLQASVTGRLSGNVYSAAQHGSQQPQTTWHLTVRPCLSTLPLALGCHSAAHPRVPAVPRITCLLLPTVRAMPAAL